eukprot:CAMPEP_0201649914 /NCGR_PEP_ID=MMETSP0493-20130528/40229_1 /ASSEMBLY_ACC=CAM_ASM_000838 /TAXON_ID=420259 /ORGANISM="Thalassiosira gravida, Strain GMp14c1" /LENGTH=66 /DNA_ID=CAMNT_0048125873 /DNA_START=9 /DNA_END=205 /DNA_ORIENTATION=-
MASYEALQFAPACDTKRGLVVASVMRPVWAYLDTVSMSPESMERVVMSARDSNAEIWRDVGEEENR